MFRKMGLLAMGLVGNLWVMGQIQWGGYLGPQITSARYLVKENKQETGYQTAAQAGIAMRVPFDRNLYFTPTAYYSLKGYKVTLADRAFPPGEDAKSNEVRVHTLQLAPLLNIVLSSQPSHPFVQFGPAIDIAFAGTEKITVDNGSVVERPMNFSFSEYGRFTLQGVVRAGYHTRSHLFFFLSYEHGLGSMNNADFGPVIKHRIFGLAVGKYGMPRVRTKPRRPAKY